MVAPRGSVAAGSLEASHSSRQPTAKSAPHVDLSSSAVGSTARSREQISNDSTPGSPRRRLPRELAEDVKIRDEANKAKPHTETRSTAGAACEICAKTPRISLGRSVRLRHRTSTPWISLRDPPRLTSSTST
ncbi:hypothetical protein TIFTF001_022296 [Ficus carica]|uniref:Uncharacterized protein n=1 Tax=Ficus carica TaxID=3494 RepID=A0AA88DBK6_FICCA|nr:hypothetical protein TIFTF001_022296 [Ficus carica]